MPYMRFSRSIFESVKMRNPDLQLPEIGRKIGKMWQTLPMHEKRVYQDAYDDEKVHVCIEPAWSPNFANNYATVIPKPFFSGRGAQCP